MEQQAIVWYADVAKCQWHSSKLLEVPICFLLQDAAFIEQQRLMVYSADSTVSHQSDSSAAAAEASQSVSIQMEDKYQKLKQWKDAVGAPTFSQLHCRRDR